MPTALKKEPQQYTRVSPGIYRDSSGKLIQRLPGQRSPGKPGQPRRRNRGIPAAERGSDEAKFRGLTPEGQVKELRSDVGAFANQMFANAMGFDPNRPFVGYEQPFAGELDRARESVMGQFERTMAPEFQRQNMAFQQSMMEQGIDPNSEAYQAQFRALQNAQNEARQSAMSNAFQLGATYQQQGFGQGAQAAMMPFQQYAATENLFMVPYRTEQEARQAELNRQAQLAAARMSGGSAIGVANIQGQTARDVAAMELASQYQNQPRQPNPWNAVIGGVVQGGGAALTNYYLGNTK